jgi:hypothetical protein
MAPDCSAARRRFHHVLDQPGGRLDLVFRRLEQQFVVPAAASALSFRPRQRRRQQPIARLMMSAAEPCNGALSPGVAPPRRAGLGSRMPGMCICGRKSSRHSRCAGFALDPLQQARMPGSARNRPGCPPPRPAARRSGCRDQTRDAAMPKLIALARRQVCGSIWSSGTRTLRSRSRRGCHARCEGVLQLLDLGDMCREAQFDLAVIGRR